MAEHLVLESEFEEAVNDSSTTRGEHTPLQRTRGALGGVAPNTEIEDDALQLPDFASARDWQCFAGSCFGVVASFKCLAHTTVDILLKVSVCAWDATGKLPMALEHKDFQATAGAKQCRAAGGQMVFGVQFHPESAGRSFGWMSSGSYQGEELLSAFLQTSAVKAPVRLQHLTVQAAFSHWQARSTQLQEARRLSQLLLERFDLAVLRACYGGWRDVYGRSPAHVQRLRHHQWTLRRRDCFRRVLSRQEVDPNYQAQHLSFLLWWRSARLLRGRRLGTPQQLAYLQEVSCLLWTQDRRRELISHAVTVWWAGVTQQRTEVARNTAERRRMALLKGCDALTRDEPSLRAAALALRVLLAWQQSREAGHRHLTHRKVKSSMAGILGAGVRRTAWALVSSCLAAWQHEARHSRIGRRLQRRRENCWHLWELLDGRDRLHAILGDWLLLWRCSLWESRSHTFASELQILAGLLQESTITCRELRTQLLTLRGNSSRLNRAALWAAW
ncbi:Uncharacterized protein SCF082_LOCUS10088 [Durusdinium trenchii]|uniref:Glutamine amidotransferase domain-containing protein n=1 Tax=Durusdinium trenchii TaxID=1381693 RepID=A0ABP0J3N2_9DINO